MLRVPRFRKAISTCYATFGPNSSRVVPRHRYYADSFISRPPQKPAKNPEDDQQAPSHQVYSESAEHSFRMMWKFIKYFAYGSAGLAATLYVSWRGIHQWVEHYELASSPHTHDPYEWDRERVLWTGPPQKGGTDRRLGWRGRSLVRGTWMALNWGDGLDAGVIEATSSDPDAPIFDKRLNIALTELSTAIRIAKNIPVLNRSDGTLDPTMLDLYTIHASILERIGTPETLEAAKETYETLQSAYIAEKHGPEAARVAVKVGDVTARLGDIDEAITWWEKALELSGIDIVDALRAPVDMNNVSVLTKSLIDSGDSYSIATHVTPTPVSPYAQRTVASALISLSGHLSAKRDLHKALALQVKALSILPQLLSPHPSPSFPNTIDRVLHELNLTHRAAVLQTHLAEVLYALQKSSSSGFFSKKKNSTLPASTAISLALLQNATLKTERISQVLTIGPSGPLNSLSSSQSHSIQPLSSLPLLPIISSSRILSDPALSLLRQSKRVTTHALNLSGLLLEEMHKYEESLESLERALAWAGGTEGHDDEVVENEWKAVWSNYVRVRERVLKRSKKIKAGK